MKDNSFEKQINNKLNNLEVQPSEGLFESILNKRAARPRRFAGIGYSGLAMAIVIISIAGIVFINWDEKYETPARINSDQALEIQKVEKIEKTSESDQDKNQQVNKLSNEMLAYKKHSDPVENDKNALIAKSSEQTKPMQKISDPLPVIIELKDKRKDFPALENEKVLSEIGLPFENYFNIESSPRIKIDFESHQGNSHLYVYQSASDVDIAKHNMLYNRVSKIKKLKVNYNSEDISEANSPELLKKKTIGKKNPVFVDVLFSPSFNIHNTYGSSDLNQVSNAMSKASYNSQYGMRISVPISNQWSIFSGLFNRNQSNAYKGQLNYQTDETRIDEKTYFINDPVSGGVIVVKTYDTMSYIGQNSQIIDHKNTYKLWQVPVGISYNFGYKKFDFAIHASALINVFRNSSGYALDINQHQANAFSSQNTFIGIGSGLSWMAAYRVSPKFKLILEPGIQYIGINSIKAGNNVKEKAFNSHLSIGLRYTVF